MKNKRLFQYLPAAAITAAFAVCWIIPGASGASGPGAILAKLEHLVATHGYAAVFVGALLEAMLFASWYLPGSTVVMVGMLLAGRGALNFPQVILSAACGFILGYAADFLMGRHGWYRLIRLSGLERFVIRARERVAASHALGYMLLFWHPHSGVLAATAAGCLRLSARRFVPLTMLAVIFWTSVWGTLCFFLGKWALDLMNNGALLLGAVVVALIALTATRSNGKRA